MQIQNPEIEYLDIVAKDLNLLIDILYEKAYFGYIDSAKQYVVDMKNYIEQHLSRAVKYPAPAYFTKYGESMQYITYHSTKHTTWYIFFQQKENRFLVRHITNNHVAGQYIR
jgi:hypothetical protein